MNKVTIVVTFLNGETTTFSDKTFDESMFLLWTSKLEALVPLKITFPKTGKVLYADKNAFSAFLDGDINLQEVIEKTECEVLVRNINELYFNEKEMTIFPNSLWKKIANKCILVDDDDFVSFDWHETQFKNV